MLRFYGIHYNKSENIEVISDILIADDDIWENSVNIVKEHEHYHPNRITIIPIRNEKGMIAAYGYQDNEANRELRMLKELMRCRDALRFSDIFPKVKEVIICGCNELAVRFAKYIETLGIEVSVTGKYWEWFGYVNNHVIDFDGKDKMVIFAEGVFQQKGDLECESRRSVSPEFECVDKIYEANVLEGKIRDTTGSFDDLLFQISNGQEIVILGDGNESQDAYDLLLKNGVDIYGFAVEKKQKDNLLGKIVMGIDEAMEKLCNPVFLDCHGRNSALGEENTEYFDYRGYERNKNYFLLRDYTDIPVSNLIHVLCNKKVVLTGDKRLCQILYKYLQKIEKGNVNIEYIGLNQDLEAAKDYLICNVFPDYKNRMKDARNRFKEHYCLSNIKIDNYTEYFARSRSFALIEEYLNGDEKYAISDLTPKGILIGRIPCASGNVFLRGILDGHPEILLMPYSDLNDNLFWYCVRLAENASDEILKNFWEMYDEEARSRKDFFPDSERFEISCKRFLQKKVFFTSQELFVIFHIAYAEMLTNIQICNVNNLVIYWEPHSVPRYDVSFFTDWLSDKKVNVQAISLVRDNIVRTGSTCSRVLDSWNSALDPFWTMFEDGTAWDGKAVKDQAEQPEFKMRFEDVKLNPKDTLGELCRRMDVEWLDTMLKTTSYGQQSEYRDSTDFTLKPVFNKYSDFLSEFDRFRVSIACSPYQKKYGYTYDNCLKFSRREIQEMFIKPFLFEDNEKFLLDSKERMRVYEYIKWKLWNVRKHMVLDDIDSEFGELEIK